MKVLLEMVDAPLEVSSEFAPPGEAPKVTNEGFFRGDNCNFHPNYADIARENFCEHFLLKGFAPQTPIIAKTSRITAFGSCFAHNIANHLAKRGFDLSRERAPDIHISTVGEGLVNVHSILSQFRWALEDWRPPEGLWHGPNARLFSADKGVRDKTREVFLATDVFIVTIGISEIWYDEATGGVFWRAVPKGAFDPSRHKFRVASVSESVAAIAEIHHLIRSHTSAEIVFTLSPVPLIATFRNISSLTANATSKAILRAAFDEFFASPSVRDDAKCRYFPAYEAVTTQFPSVFDDDWHHPHQFVIDAIMQIFEAYYCETALTKKQAEDNFRAARARSARWSARSPDLSNGTEEIDPNLERARIEIAHLRKAYGEALGAIESLKKANIFVEEAFHAAHRSSVERAREAETLRAALAERGAGPSS